MQLNDLTKIIKMMTIVKSMKRLRRELQRLHRRSKKIPSGSAVRLLLGLLLLYFYTSVIMVFLINHHRNKIPERYLSSTSHRLRLLPAVSSIEEKCSKHPSWYNDHSWKTAIVDPILCGASTAGDATTGSTPLREQQLLLFKETMYNYSHFKEPPCGQYCVYPFQSVFSYSYGQPILGYALISSPDNHNEKCWKPFTTQYEYNPCGNQHYNEWINTMETYISTAIIQVYSSASAIAAESSSITDTRNDSGSSRKNSDIIQIVNAYILERSIERYNCLNIKAEMNTTTYDKLKLWLPSSSKNRRTEEEKQGINDFLSRTKAMEQEIQSSPFCTKSMLEIFDPSDMAQIYDSNQLGLHNLADAISIFNDSNSSNEIANTNESTLLCNSESNKCIYHHHSVPSNVADDNHPMKGWEYSSAYQCFIPIVDMTDHAICGRNSNQYKFWSQRMMQKKSSVALDGPMSVSKKSSKASCAKCDKLPLSMGQYFWDYNQNSYKAIHVPPTDENSVCGPRVIFAGALNCGTNVLAPLLALHPRIKLNLCPDSSLENCNINHFQGDYNNYTHNIASVWDGNGLSHGYMSDPINYIGRYSQKLPIIMDGDEHLTFDVSPTYLNTGTFLNIAQRTHEVLPSAKIIISVCDPVKRMHSEYDQFWNHQIYGELFYRDRNVRVPRDFDEFVKDMDLESINCQNNPDFCLQLRRDKLDTGRYVDHIRQWQNYYGKDNVLVINMEDNNKDKMKKIFNMMGDCLPDNEYAWDTVFTADQEMEKTYKNGEITYTEAHKWLYEYFEEPNADLSNLIGEAYPKTWKMKKL